MDSEYPDNTKTPSSHNNNNQQHHPVPSNSELFSSAKLVAQSAKGMFGQGSDKVDKGQVAEAMEDLLGAASRYGKLDEKGLGKYVDKAENYLHQYHSSDSSTTPDAAGHHSTTTTSHHTPSHQKPDNDEESGSGGGYGDYIKMAQGFLKK